MLIYFLLISTILGYNQDTVHGRECGYPGKPNNGTFEPCEQVFYPGDEVSYSCHKNFILKGSQKRGCTVEGTWNGKLPLCRENVALNKPATQSDVLWNYSPGLAVDGDSNSCSFTSRKEGQRWWQVSLNRHLSVESVWITMSPGAYQKFSIFVVEILDGSTAEYKPCTLWEGRFRNQRQEFVCGNSSQRGQFVYIRDDRLDSEYFGLCEVEVFQELESHDCGSPELPLNTELTALSASAAEYTCTPGYTLTSAFKPVLNCTKDGWQGSIPSCTEVSCDHPSSAKDGFIEVSNFRGNYVYGSRAKYHCNPGFILWGNSTRICESSGAWTGQTPVCRPISCGEPPMYPRTAVSLISGSTQWKAVAQYNCMPGFAFPQGQEVVRESTCQESGLWTLVSFTCVSSSTAHKPLNTVWIKKNVGGDGDSNYVILILLGGLAVVLSGISILAAFLSVKKWWRKSQYRHQDNIFIEKPLLDSNHEKDGLGMEHQNANPNPHNFSSFHLSPVSSGRSRSSSRALMTGLEPKLSQTMPRLPSNRFTYADMNDVSLLSFNVNKYDDKIQYANVNPQSLHYATLARDSRSLWKERNAAGAQELKERNAAGAQEYKEMNAAVSQEPRYLPQPRHCQPLHYATLSRVPRPVEPREMPQSETVPDILQTLRLHGFTNPHPAQAHQLQSINPHPAQAHQLQSINPPNQQAGETLGHAKPNIIVNQLSGLEFSSTQDRLIDIEDCEAALHAAVMQTNLEDTV